MENAPLLDGNRLTPVKDSQNQNRFSKMLDIFAYALTDPSQIKKSNRNCWIN